jgi:hypothetical protein
VHIRKSFKAVSSPHNNSLQPRDGDKRGHLPFAQRQAGLFQAPLRASLVSRRPSGSGWNPLRLPIRLLTNWCQHELVSAEVDARCQHELVSATPGVSTNRCQHRSVSARIGVSTNWCLAPHTEVLSVSLKYSSNAIGQDGRWSRGEKKTTTSNDPDSLGLLVSAGTAQALKRASPKRRCKMQLCDWPRFCVPLKPEVPTFEQHGAKRNQFTAAAPRRRCQVLFFCRKYFMKRTTGNLPVTSIRARSSSRTQVNFKKSKDVRARTTTLQLHERWCHLAVHPKSGPLLRPMSWRLR